MKRKIGFIGLGVLGSAIVPNLIEDGFDVIGYDIRPETMEKLELLGMLTANSPCDAALVSDVLITCLPTVNALLDVYGGKAGIDKAQKSGQIVIETSTFPVEEKEKAMKIMNMVGKKMLDCPVSGNRILAVKKELTAFASGDENAFNEVQEIILGFAPRTFYVGPFGNGMKMKFCANILNLVHNSVAAEIMVLGMKSGLEPELIHNVISGSGSSSSMFETRGLMMANNNYEHEGMNFSTPIKDSRFISDHAHKLQVPTPIYHVALQSYYAAIAQGHFDEDAAAVCAAMERAANIERTKKEKKTNDFYIEKNS